MKTYDLVISTSLKDLIKVTNEAIEQGYIPQGGIVQVNGAFIQAIYNPKL